MAGIHAPDWNANADGSRKKKKKKSVSALD